MTQHQDAAAGKGNQEGKVGKGGKIVLVDPISFRGGSKVATEVMLDELAGRFSELTCHVLTLDPDSWPRCRHHRLWLPSWLRGRESGAGYLLKQGWQTLMILALCWRLGQVRCLLAASGPGVDLCSYWAARVLGIPVVQLIHGPVAAPASRRARCGEPVRSAISRAAAPPSGHY